MLTADGPHYATPDEVLAQLGERPSTNRQSHVARRRLSQAQDLCGLPGRDADWCPASQALPHTEDAEWCEGLQVRVYGVHMDLKRSSNLGRLQASGVQHDGLSMAPLPRREIVFMAWSGRTSTVRGLRVFKDRGMAGPPTQDWRDTDPILLELMQHIGHIHHTVEHHRASR